MLKQNTVRMIGVTLLFKQFTGEDTTGIYTFRDTYKDTLQTFNQQSTEIETES